MISGIEGKQFLVNSIYNADEVASAVEAACKEVLGRTGGAGFPIIFEGYTGSKMSIIKRGVERAGATVLFYNKWSNESCSEAEVEEWLRRMDLMYIPDETDSPIEPNGIAKPAGAGARWTC